MLTGLRDFSVRNDKVIAMPVAKGRIIRDFIKVMPSDLSRF